MSDTQQITSKAGGGSDKAGPSGGQGTTSSSVQVRSKAMKVLADLCQLDDGSLGLAQDPKVRACFDACIQDDSISVREAAVDLISGLSARSGDLALGYFDLLVHACSDPGASVQKQAVRTLWEACSLPLDFPRRLEAAATIVLRVHGMEESIKARTVKLLRNFWLSTSSAGGESSVDHLCAVVWTIFCEQKTRSGNGLVVPFTRDHPVVHLFECVFNASCLDCSGPMKLTLTEKAAVIKAGKSFCRKIVDAILHEEASGDPAPGENQADQDQNSGQAKERDDRVLKYLVTLHALAVAEPKLCSRGNNQHYYIECLLPHLLYDQSNLRTQSEDAASRAQAKVAKKSNAEKLTCVLSIISSNIAVTDVLGDHVCATLTTSLQKLIGLHDFLSVVAKACELLCRLCKFSTETAHFVTKLMSSILDSLEHHASGGQGQRSSTFLRRRLFVLGHLWRNTSDPADGQDALPPILLRTVSAITHWLVDRVQEDASPSRALIETPIAIEALRALGMTIFGNAKVALIEEVKEVYALYLGLDCAPALQVCALRGMTEMIKKEETKVLELQQIQLKESNSFRKTKGGSSALDTVCGEGEVSIAGTVLRFFWEKSVLPLALHVRWGGSWSGSGPQAEESPSAAVSLAGLGLLNRPLKLAAMEVFDSVLRQGLVAPWTAVPTLVALCGYPDHLVYTKACHILKSYIMDKRMDFFESKLIDAVQTLYQQTIELSTISGSFDHKSAKILSPEMLAGIGALYNLLWDKRRTKTAFLRYLMRSFAKALQASGSEDRKREGLRGPSDSIDLKMLAFCANLCVGKFSPLRGSSTKTFRLTPTKLFLCDVTLPQAFPFCTWRSPCS